MTAVVRGLLGDLMLRAVARGCPEAMRDIADAMLDAGATGQQVCEAILAAEKRISSPEGGRR